jgi:hypothetical protein
MPTAHWTYAVKQVVAHGDELLEIAATQDGNVVLVLPTQAHKFDWHRAKSPHPDAVVRLSGSLDGTVQVVCAAASDAATTTSRQAEMTRILVVL